MQFEVRAADGALVETLKTFKRGRGYAVVYADGRMLRLRDAERVEKAAGRAIVAVSPAQ